MAITDLYHSLLTQVRSHSQDDGKAFALFTFAALGAGWLATYALSLAAMARDLVVPGMSLSKFGAKKGAYAVVTGATAGIGRDFALQLAKAGFNIVLASRTQARLEEIAAEIKAKSPETKVVCHAIDFSSAKASDYANFERVLAPLDVGILVNNVGKSYDYPEFFVELGDQDVEDMIQININATLRVTKLVLPGMIKRKRGLVLSVGSFSSLIPTPLLAVYSGTKSFLNVWSQALGSELKGTGVVVECTTTAFVATKLSGIRRTSLSVPSPSSYVRTVLSHVGQSGGAVAQPCISNPHPVHAVMQWAIDHLFTRAFWIQYNRKMHVDIRRRALKKKERLAAAAKKD